MENDSLKPIIEIYSQIEEEPLHLYFYRATHNRKNKTILYSHGGGLVYGSALDLPNIYLEMILQAGYDFVSFEYPLAPETKLRTIREKLFAGVTWFQEHYQHSLDLSSPNYILFGRSAGAYLSLLMAQKSIKKPDALLLFYGYYTLQDATFQIPSRHYLIYPKVNEMLIKQLVKSTPVVEGPIELRFGLYIYYRQTGNWIKAILGEGEKATTYSLSKEDLIELPPTFLAASTGDPDVPYRLSVKMSRDIPQSYLETIDSDEHDFDRTTTESIGPLVYEKMLSWLGKL